MKIRIKGNSVRLRLTKTEVIAFCAMGVLEDRVNFPNKVLVYALKKKDGISNMEADFSKGKITIYISEDLIDGWDSNEKVGFKACQNLEDKGELMLLLEKDFQCLDSTIDEQSDNYPSPRA